MTDAELKTVFEKFDSEYLKFDRVSGHDRICNSPDACALALLSKRLGLDGIDAITNATHGKVYLAGPDYGDHENWPLSEDDVLFLVRCGVYMSEEDSSLCMLV